MKGTEIVITPPAFDNVMMGFPPNVWIVGVKTWRGGEQYGRLFQSSDKVHGPCDIIALHCRDQLFRELDAMGIVA